MILYLENHVVLSPFCAPDGKSYFGARSFVGMKATILQGMTIGEDAIVSIGFVVFRNVPAGARRDGQFGPGDPGQRGASDL